jgi:hypothetical protein
MARTKMTASEFYSKLSGLLEKGYRLTRDAQSDPNADIRLVKPNVHKSFCPITAVAHAETGKYFPSDDYQKANKYLGLHYDVAEAIVCAADTSYDCVRTRSKLKKALGLPTA